MTQGPTHPGGHGERPPRPASGAVSLDGRLIDIASIRMAEALMTKARAIGAPAATKSAA